MTHQPSHEREERAPTPIERAILALLLEKDGPGFAEYRTQVEAVSVRSNCECGCGSIALKPDPMVSSRAASGLPTVVADANVILPDEIVGGIILFQEDGFLAHLEIWSVADPLQFPAIEHVALSGI